MTYRSNDTALVAFLLLHDWRVVRQSVEDLQGRDVVVFDLEADEEARPAEDLVRAFDLDEGRFQTYSRLYRRLKDAVYAERRRQGV